MPLEAPRRGPSIPARASWRRARPLPPSGRMGRRGREGPLKASMCPQRQRRDVAHQFDLVPVREVDAGERLFRWPKDSARSSRKKAADEASRAAGSTTNGSPFAESRSSLRNPAHDGLGDLGEFHGRRIVGARLERQSGFLFARFLIDALKVLWLACLACPRAAPFLRGKIRTGATMKRCPRSEQC